MGCGPDSTNNHNVNRRFESRELKTAGAPADDETTTKKAQ